MWKYNKKLKVMKHIVPEKSEHFSNTFYDFELGRMAAGRKSAKIGGPPNQKSFVFAAFPQRNPDLHRKFFKMLQEVFKK